MRTDCFIEVFVFIAWFVAEESAVLDREEAFTSSRLGWTYTRPQRS